MSYSIKPLLATTVDALEPFLCLEHSLVDIARENNITVEELNFCLEELLENKSLKEIRAGFIMRKDAQGRYLWYSKNAWDLAAQKPPKLVGFTDFDVAPEQAEFYRALDAEVMSSLERKSVSGNKEISAKLELSFRTVESYIAIIKEKFNVSTKSDLIDTIINLGFLEKLV